MNKISKIVISILGIILVLWSIVFTVDFIRCSCFMMPVFVVAGETADDGGSGIYYGLGYQVKVEKNISAEDGPELIKVEMYMFDKFITGAIANIHITVDDTNGNGSIITQPQIHNSFVGTVIEETTTYMIVEPNEDEPERKSADRIVINYGTDHIDYLYGIGIKVIINYTGYIMETYPAQINTDNIQIYKAE